MSVTLKPDPRMGETQGIFCTGKTDLPSRALKRTPPPPNDQESCPSHHSLCGVPAIPPLPPPPSSLPLEVRGPGTEEGGKAGLLRLALCLRATQSVQHTHARQVRGKMVGGG